MKRRSPGGPPPTWAHLHDLGQRELADRLDLLTAAGALTDVEVARVQHLLGRAERDDAQASGALDIQSRHLLDALATNPPTGLTRARDIPRRRSLHHVAGSAVRVGHIPDDPRNPGEYHGHSKWLNTNILRTSALIIGPPGSGKTTSFAEPVVECLGIAALVGTASVVVIDVKGDDFDWPGFFDVTINLRDPARSAPFDLYGGSTDPGVATDQLASALLSTDTDPAHQYFHNAARNALYDALAAFHAAHDRFPTVRQLIGVLHRDPAAVQSLTDRLRNRHRTHELVDLGHRARQLNRREDPAASLVEQLRQLDRPHFRTLLDQHQQIRFALRQINQPIRVRVALDEGRFPEASRILTRLVVSQFVHTVSAADANTTIYKGLVLDEAGRYIDDYTTRGLQRLRSRNAGLTLLTQTLSDIPEQLRGTILGSTGTQAVFGGISPTDAQYFSDAFGTRTTLETRYTTGTQDGQTDPRSFLEPPGHHRGTTNSASHSWIEKPLFSPSDLIHLPAGHAVVTTTSATGHRTPPTLTDLRRQAAALSARRANIN